MTRPRVGVIINPVSGTGRDPAVVQQRRDLAASLLHAHGIDSAPILTERPGHGRELAAALVDDGVGLVIAWGGDGTVNEVGSALAFRDATLAIIPSGSGNGLARELGVPLQPAAAFAVALAGRDRMMDAGEIDGRLFFNVAGFGLDARVAHAFAAGGLVRRGLPEYVKLAARELLAFTPQAQTVIADGETLRGTPLIVAIANTRQYGNGALIAPQARIDDGQLDVVIVEYRALWRTVWHVPRLFTGGLARVPGVRMRQAVEVVVSSDRPLLFHLDGEPGRSDVAVSVRVRPQALRVRVPKRA